MKSEAVDELVQKAEPVGTPETSVHLLDLLIILTKRRRFILWFTLGAAVLTAIVVFIISPKYTATTVVMPPSQNSSMSSALLSQLGGSSALASAAGAGLGIKNPGDMYVSLFRSQTVEDALIRRFDLMARYRLKRMSDTRTAFEDRSTVVLGVKDGLIRISVTDRDPKLSADIANGYVEEFRKLSASLAITEASQRRIFFQQQLLEANEGLAKAEEAMKSTEQSTGVLQIDSQAKALIEAAGTLRGQIAAKEVQLSAMRSYATEDNPQMVLAEQQLVALKEQLAKLSGKGDSSESDIIVSKGNIPQAGMEYIRKLRDVKYYETITELIARQFEMAKLDEARQGAVIQVADPALPPDKRSSPKRTLIIAMVALAAFVLAAFWIVVAEGYSKARRAPVLNEKLSTLRASF
jgi:tyrosine-protein kinase Etk/Wzc